MAKYVMTAKRKAALRKAQAVSARKRRGKGNGKLAKAHRRSSRNAKIALATGGLALASMGVAGAYARKTARGGPKPKKLNHSTARASLSGSLSLGDVLNNRSMSLNQVRANLANPNYVWQL